MAVVDLGHGFRAVPYDSVTLNGHYLAKLDRGDGEPRYWALLAPNGYAVDSADGKRPHRYADLDECRANLPVFLSKGCSTCGPVWEPPGAGPCKDYEHESESGMGDVALMLGWETPEDDQGFWTHPLRDPTHDSDLRDVLIAQLKAVLASYQRLSATVQRLDTYKEWHPCLDDACVICHPLQGPQAQLLSMRETTNGESRTHPSGGTAAVETGHTDGP